MRAFVTRHDNTIESDRKLVFAAAPSRDDDVRTFTQYATAVGMPSDPGKPGNVLYANAPRTFELLLIGPSIQLFAEAWGRAFLRHCCSMLKPDGLLIVPVRDARQAEAEGTWSVEALSEFLDPSLIESLGRFAAVRGPRPLPGDHSILDWFSRAAIPSLSMDLIARYAAPDAALTADADTSARMDYPGQRTPDADEGPVQRLARAVGVHLDEEIARAVHNQSYYVNGISYKATLLKHIARTHLPDRASPALIDFGGGYGLLMAEMALDPEFKVRKVVVQDIQEQNRVMALHLFSQFDERLDGRFFFSSGRAEAFRFTEAFDMISFVGSLLYVPKDLRLGLLERCWDALMPGGVLVIHENIQAPSYTRDFEYMFQVDELDELMGRFGAIQRYLSNARKPVSKADASAKTVFRVVQKM